MYQNPKVVCRSKQEGNILTSAILGQEKCSNLPLLMNKHSFTWHKNENKLISKIYNLLLYKYIKNDKVVILIQKLTFPIILLNE